MATEDRHMCHCGKGFLRKEHLRRHQATHARPSFVCPICERSFTRNDVLKRHVAVHDTAQTAPTRTWRACDACHENKTKCDGGDQCALCAKRGVECTYGRDMSSLEADSGGTGGEEQETGDAAVEDTLESAFEDHVMGSPTPADTIISESITPPEDPVEIARAGLECVSNAVSAAMTGKKHIKGTNRSWVSKCTQTYFRGFHERWPIVHAPVFDAKTDGTLFVASVLMIGSWYGDDESVRDSIFKLHDRFMFYLSRKIVAGEAGPDREWPYDIYQIILLHIIFAFESGRRSLFLGANRLLVLLVTALRSNGSFNAVLIEMQETKHHPGTFRPWLFGCRARWRRLAALTMKVDTYFGLLCNQPPVLQAEELELELPSLFSSWNAYGIHKFFQREHEEPPWRDQLTMADLIGGTVPSSGLQIEDVALGLCGSYREIWKWARAARSDAFGHSIQALDGAAVTQQLESWKTRLDEISNLWTEPQLKATEINFLLRAYRGDEEADHPGWENASLTRIAVFCLDAKMLYHLLALHLHADVRSLSTVTVGSPSLGGGPSVTHLPLKGSTLCQWAMEPRARSAAIHSIFILKAYENALATMEDVCHTMDPIAQVALCTAAIVMRGWFANTSCECHGGRMQSLNIDDVTDRDRWVQINSEISVDNVALCRCSSGPWMARFVSALTQGGHHWEMSGSIAEYLRKPLEG